MVFQIEIEGRQFACNLELEGVFELRKGAYMQHRGTGETPRFRSEEDFKQFVLKMLRGEA